LNSFLQRFKSFFVLCFK